jgi:hypothetical protein
MSTDLNHNFLVNKGIRKGGNGNKIARSILDYQVCIRTQKYEKKLADAQFMVHTADLLALRVANIISSLNDFNEKLNLDEMLNEKAIAGLEGAAFQVLEEPEAKPAPVGTIIQ